jgi:hypothetical protein
VSEFSVEPQALEQFAASSMNRQHDFGDLRARMNSVHVPREGFGYVPGIGNRVYEAYDQFVEGCADSISSAAESMAEIAAAVRGVVTAYVISDQAAHDSQQTIDNDLRDVNIRGVG